MGQDDWLLYLLTVWMTECEVEWKILLLENHEGRVKHPQQASKSIFQLFCPKVLRSPEMCLVFFCGCFFFADRLYLLPPPRCAQRSGDSITSQWVSFCKNAAVHTENNLSLATCIVYFTLIALIVFSGNRKIQTVKCPLVTNKLKLIWREWCRFSS